MKEVFNAGNSMLHIKKKISHRLFAALMLIAVIPIWIMGYETYRAAQHVMINSAFTHLNTIALDHSNHLNSWFEERVNDIRLLSQLPTVRDICTLYCNAEKGQVPLPEKSGLLDNILALTRAKSSSYKSMHIFSPSGTLLASSDPSADEVPDLEHIKTKASTMKMGEPVLSPVHQHGDETWYMDLAVPIQIHEGGAAALAVAVLDVSKTLDPIMTDRVGLGETGEAYLVNENGMLITESKYFNHLEIFKRSFSSYGIQAALDHKSGASIYVNYAGYEVVGSYLWLPRYDCGLLVEMHKDEILSPIRYIRTVALISALVVSAFCLLVALAVSRRVSLPIIRVSEAAREIANGHMERRIPPGGADEIGILVESFNSMAERLSDVIASLQEKDDSLQKAYDNLLQAQAQLVQSEKMAAIGELIASVVHEMRNPLSSVKLNLQIIGRTLKEGEPLSEHFQIALDQVVQLEKMFSDLLDYSKPIVIERTPVQIVELIEQSLVQLEPIVREEDIAIIKSIPENLPLVVGDAHKIRQVLVNIIKNAIEAVGYHGSVEISLDVSESGGKPFLSVSVSDNGPGISPKDLKRIFQPFFTMKRKGTGLGLSIVRKIIEAHGGAITVTSEEGRGTRVHIRFQGE